MSRLALILVLLCAFALYAEEDQSRLITGFEKSDDLAAMPAESAALTLSTDRGVTEGKSALKVTAKQGAEWASFLLPSETIRGWDGAETVTLDIDSDSDEKFVLHFELWDAQSHDFATRCSFSNAEVQKGKQTLRWEIAHAARNAKESSTWESLDDKDKIQLGALSKVKFYLTPSKDHDAVFYIDNLRLTKKSAAAIEVDRLAAEEAKSRKLLFKSDFEDGTGLGGKGVKFHGNWLPLDEKAAPSIDAPLGTGNASKKALTCHAWKAGENVAAELPLHGTEVEPEGWDGVISLKVFNGGFASFYMTYSPIWPSDITFHRVEFTAPKDTWTKLVLPLDKFLYQGRRARRGCQLEYICIVGVEPEKEGSVFQFDDFTVSRIKRKDAPARQPKAALPSGVVYQQNFDDPNDFEIESYYPSNNKSNVFRISGGAGKDGKATDDKDGGCLKIECYANGAEGRGGRRGFALTGAHVIEFDCFLKGMQDFTLGARGKSARYRLPVKPAPQAETWTHCTLAVKDFAAAGSTAANLASDSLWELTFGASSGNAGEHFILIDNLSVREAQAVGGK